MSRITAAFGAVTEAGLDLQDDGMDDGGNDERRDNNALDDMFTAMRDAALPRSDSAKGALERAQSSRVLRRNESLVAAASITDCPLTCSVAAIIDSIPRRLVALQAADASISAPRIWTTLCCIAVLERANVSWIWGDGDTYPAVERTIVDGAREWVESCAAERPALAELLASGSLQKRASAVTLLWRRTCDQRVAELRRSEAIRSSMNKSHLHRRVVLSLCTARACLSACTRRATTALVRAITSRHETFAVFLSEPLDGLQRWQMFIIIVSLVLSQLLVNIWMCGPV